MSKAVINATGPKATPRVRQLTAGLIRHLHDFARENELTVDEWMVGVELMNAAGRMSDSKRNEGQLLCDILGLESLVDEITFKLASAAADEPTATAILGPFYRHGAPELPMGSCIVSKEVNETGDRTLMHGTVTDFKTGKPIEGAVIDVWHTAPNGLYEQQDPNQPDMNLRGRFTTGKDGAYSFYCLRPVPYPIPYDGPAGLQIAAPGYKPIVTQIFDRQSKYLEDDAVFAVKDSLIVDFKPFQGDPNADFELPYDFKMASFEDAKKEEVSRIRRIMEGSKITLGQYMWERIHQIGVDTVFGVPGDFNLQFLDSIYLTKGLRFITNQNELNGAYAADGYSRVKNVPGCLVTTHGVGELSALNGIAGSMSEHVKLIHVVGQTTRGMQKAKMMIHHSIGAKPDHQVYNKASEGFRVAAAELWDVESAPGEIDRVLRECVMKSSPVYIFLPLDLSAEMVDTSLLDEKIDLEPKVDKAAEDAAVKAIAAAVGEAKHPTIVVDALVHRFGAAEEAKQLVDALSVPFFSTPMGKGIVDETHAQFVGVWNGEVSSPGVKEAAKQADLTITLGYIPADTNSAGFSRPLAEERTIHINPHDVIQKIPKPTLPGPRTPLDANASHLTQSALWPAIEAFLRPGDVLLSETGTSSTGVSDMTFPANIRLNTQIYYASIGWATAATLGVDVARRELAAEGGRTILFTGDGSMALTIQEIGTMIKNKCKVILFVLNNEGYTVERLIWGARQPYNDIVPHDYSHLLPLYKHPSPETSYHRATTSQELQAILQKPQLQDLQDVQLVEVVLDKLDTSWKLSGVLAFRSQEHRDYLTREGFVDTYGGWGWIWMGGLGGR
ncbi:pyruvate decarboxylase [Pyrenophora seminiperda CCB06]|uniref:Pyruvate decarboxylase n=1 Tax=Pyrenophora seminiperda CCB06 TaxID=1302712 RepID=A0A3M7M6B4_9PLEO|nr:pyruvate decarboxylase [Pyrenophora seminiperda CCB06]